MARTIVVGAGLGGLSAAIRLAARGWAVSMYEKNSYFGGRMSTVSAEGYTWDVGPTLIMMPEILRELFAGAGRQLEDYITLRRVDPYYRVVFENDGWTVRTADGSLSAHFEHTVAITKKGPLILTALDR